MRRRNKPEEGKGGAAEWLVTYSDMVTLLLTFFVLLFSFSTIDAQKWKALVLSLNGRGIRIEDTSGNNGVPGDSESEDPLEIDEINSYLDGETDAPSVETVDDNFEKLYRKIKDYVEENNLVAQIDIEKSRTQILLRFKDNVLFDSGRADLKKEAIQILGDISVVLKDSIEDIEMIRIEGHTDDVPIKTVWYPTNWELSTARAVQVLRFFIEKKGLEPAKMSAVGYGEYHPIRTNDTDANRALNRRVDLVIAKYIEKSDGT